MPKEKQEKLLCVDDLRHAEYYQMQEVFDELYAKSKRGEIFSNLMDLILKRENILLAYRNIKTNTGSNTPGTDRRTIRSVGKLSPEEVVAKVRYILTGSVHGYRPKPVRRKDIPKPNGKTRPLGIPCIWDRLIQQCIKQVMEPICEAKFSNNSYGFRPNRKVEHAIARSYKLMQQSNLHYVIEFDIEGFFDNVNHVKLIRQIWAMGIHDRHLIYVIRQILKAPIRMPDGQMITPVKGTPQGGIISPLLANIVLNELDHWIDSQWQENPVTDKYAQSINSNGTPNKGNGYEAMRQTNLKEMYIVRYADDFRIFCRNRRDAERTKIAVTQWLSERLKLKVSEEKTRIVNVRKKNSEFLGFKMKVRRKGQKLTVRSHICDKALKQQMQALSNQAKNIAKPREPKSERDEIILYNSMVMGVQNYYCIATDISRDCKKLEYRIDAILTNRLKSQRGNRLVKKGRKLTKAEQARYGKSQMLRYVAGSKEPIYPVSFVQCKNPMNKKVSINCYTAEGRKGLHDNLRLDTGLMLQMMREPSYHNSVEYMDNRISLFSAQWGKCAVTGEVFKTLSEIHCHHKVSRSRGGTDKYENLVLVTDAVHRLIHAKSEETIQKYLQMLKLDKEQLKKLNKLRKTAGLTELAA